MLIGSGVAVLVGVIAFVVAGARDEGVLLPTPRGPGSQGAAQAGQTQGDRTTSASVGIAGTWESNYGPVTIEHDEIGPELAVVAVTGSWIQGPDRTGQITSGRYDPDAGTLEIEYVETWSDVPGSASFQLSEDGSVLDGTYTQPGANGDWTLTR